MKKYYHMLVQSIKCPSMTKTYISPRQGSAPAGWKCIAVMGYHEK